MLAAMYLADDRFRQLYDRVGEGTPALMHDSLLACEAIDRGLVYFHKNRRNAVFYLLINTFIFTADKPCIRLRQGFSGQTALEMPFGRALVVAALAAHAKGAATIGLLQLL